MTKTRVIFISDNDPALYDALVMALQEKDLYDVYRVRKINIFGLSTYSSLMRVFPDNIMYANFSATDIAEIVSDNFVNNTVNQKFLYHDETKEFIGTGAVPFYHKQYRIVLRNCGVINPESLGDYIGRQGYKALAKIVSGMTQEQVIDEMKVSGLRGRGGAGFPTWMKWNFSRQVNAAEKCIVCNADEGDPGAYMDRSVLEGDPHSVLEGMAIAGFAIGANQGYIYCRAEYPLAIARLERAIADATSAGLLGNNILGTGFSFNIEIRLGAGAFVCGEETALIASIEGNRGMPRPRPPFPAVKGLWNMPTVINNVETLANVPFIMLKGGAHYAKIGTEKSKGTKVFALTGKVKNSGLVEVPMGTTLREIVFDVGGGIARGRKIKAVQTGGPSGGVIPEQYLDTPISYESLSDLGSIMGSGGMIVLDEADCVVDISKFYLQFMVDESCGKCAPCRIGCVQLLSILNKLSRGEAEQEDIVRLKEISKAMQVASLCGLGQTASNPVSSTLRYFAGEYAAHVENKKCPAGKCRALISFGINVDKCIGCGLCARRCPVKCITGVSKKPHVIDQSQCIKCGECFSACKFKAVKRD
jgi:NADH:ubiquinone oxidoreductase subunit F (NADH-binding)